MFAVAYGTRVAVINQMTTQEEWAFITRSEGLEALQNLIHLPVHITQLHFGFYVQSRHLLFGCDMRRYILFKTTLELRQVGYMHTQTGSELMSSEVCQQIPTGVDCGVDIKIADRTGTAADDIIFSGRQYDGRAIVGFRQAAGCYSHHSFVPVGRIDHCSVKGRIHRIFFQLLQRLIGGLAVIIAAILVIGIDILCKPQSGFGIVRNEESNRFRTALDTSGGINTRTYLIYQVADCDGLAFYPRHSHDGLQTNRRLGIECAQTVKSENTVLTRYRHDIAGNGHRQQGQ